MNYLHQHQFDLGAESQHEAIVSTEALERKADRIRQQKQMLAASDTRGAMSLDLELAQILSELDQPEQAWPLAFSSMEYYLRESGWEQAIVACDILFKLNQEQSLAALGHGLWLSITFPVNVTLTLSQLQHVIDETPEDSDGAAVAAAMAAYVCELRDGADLSSEATLATGQMLNDVARRHGNVDNQATFEQWFERLELHKPEKIIVRMRNIIDVLVQDQWWFDRQALQSVIPAEE